VFYADPTTVQTSTPTWLTVLPIGISLVALIFSGLQFLQNRSERRRIMPTISMSATFTDQWIAGRTPADMHKTVMVEIHNKGREETNLGSLNIYAKNFIVNGLNCLLSGRGDRIARDSTTQSVPGFTRKDYFIDASMLDTDEIMVAASFGHEAEIRVAARLNQQGKQKALSARQVDKIFESWGVARSPRR
jgi:hypothetical protein